MKSKAPRDLEASTRPRPRFPLPLALIPFIISNTISVKASDQTDSGILVLLRLIKRGEAHVGHDMAGGVHLPSHLACVRGIVRGAGEGAGGGQAQHGRRVVIVEIGVGDRESFRCVFDGVLVGSAGRVQTELAANAQDLPLPH